MKSKQPTLDVTHPDLALQWHPTKNDTLAASDVTPGSGKSVWWVCPVDGYEFNARVSHRSAGSRCPVCAGNKIVAGINDALTKNPMLRTQLDTTLNSVEELSQLAANSPAIFAWRSSCGHSWTQAVEVRNRDKNGSCPVCSGNLLVAGVNDFATTHPGLAQQWHPTKNVNLPSQVTGGSGITAWWLCSYGHEWPATPQSRTGKNKAGCLVCSNRLVIPGINDVATTHPHLMSEWHPTKNGVLAASTLSPGNKQRVWWKCAKGHVWDAHLYNRTGPREQGCPACTKRVSKAETDLAKFVGTYAPVKRNVRSLLPGGSEVDIYVPSLSLAIEFNGLYWHSEQKGKTKEYHLAKALASQKVGLTLVQVWEDDWNRNSGAVKQKIARLLSPLRSFQDTTVTYEAWGKQRAQTWFEKYDHRQVLLGDNNLALKSDNEVVALAAIVGQRLTYTERVASSDGMVLLLKEIRDPSLVVEMDNSWDDSSMYINAGLQKASSVGPQRSYLHRNTRVAEDHPAVSDRSYSIWDAGWSTWRQ